MADITEDIRSALETRLSNITGIPTVAWENVTFNPTTGQSFVKPRYIPTIREPSVRGPNPQIRYQGIFRVECFAPEGQGPNAASAIAAKVVDSFEATTDINTDNCDINILYAERTQGLVENAHYMVGVNIGWRTFK